MSRQRKEAEQPIIVHKPLPDLGVPFPDLNIDAVAAFRVNYLTSESIVLTIKNGVVVGMKRITRAADQHATAIGQAQGVLWTQSRKNPPVKVKPNE